MYDGSLEKAKQCFLSEKKSQDFVNNPSPFPVDGTVYMDGDSISVQFYGWELVLLKDGWFVNDTSGG